MDMNTLTASEIIKILADRNITIEIKDGQIGLPKRHNLSSELLESIRSRKNEIIRLLSSPQINDTDSKPVEQQTDETLRSTDAALITPEFSEDEFAQVVDVFRLLLTQETKLRSIGLIDSINYREVCVRTNEPEEGCSNPQVVESKPKTG
jgi:hypothetical protein